MVLVTDAFVRDTPARHDIRMQFDALFIISRTKAATNVRKLQLIRNAASKILTHTKRGYNSPLLATLQ